MNTDIFTSRDIRGRNVRNRTVLAAMTNKQSYPNGELSDEELRWLALRAEGGFGVVTTCAANVLPTGRTWDGELGVYDERHIPGLARLAAALRDAGALSLCQIFHGGYRSPRRLTGGQPVSASDIALDIDSFEPARAMSRAEVRECIEAFAAAAERCERAGFDGVEIHGAHTFLITQFLSRELNRREDEYGGSLENRYRFLGEIVRACRARTGDAFIVGVRLSPGVPRPHAGLSPEETLEILPWVEDDGADFVHLSLKNAAGVAAAARTDRPHTDRAHTVAEPEATDGAVFIPKARERLSERVRVFACGGVFLREEAEQVLANGADAVAVARAGIGHADWPKRLAGGRPIDRPPYSAERLADQGLSPTFIEYMRGWSGFVAA